MTLTVGRRDRAMVFHAMLISDKSVPPAATSAEIPRPADSSTTESEEVAHAFDVLY